MNTKTSVSFAMVTATLLLAACSSEKSSAGTKGASQQALVKCEGVNECKGSSECKSSTNPNGCQGLNECKGQGWISIPKEDCDKKGGKVLAEGSAAPEATSDGSKSPAEAGAPAKTASIKCEGINECKGHGDCAGADNACKGQNECKGHGFIEVPTEQECIEKGGKAKA